jgi:hypothetical protein
MQRSPHPLRGCRLLPRDRPVIAAKSSRHRLRRELAGEEGRLRGYKIDLVGRGLGRHSRTRTASSALEDFLAASLSLLSQFGGSPCRPAGLRALLLCRKPPDERPKLASRWTWWAMVLRGVRACWVGSSGAVRVAPQRRLTADRTVWAFQRCGSALRSSRSPGLPSRAGRAWWRSRWQNGAFWRNDQAADIPRSPAGALAGLAVAAGIRAQQP